MGASCTVMSVCGLAEEASQYTKDTKFINTLVLFCKLPSFRTAVELAQKEGRAEGAIVYHKDGTPTYLSAIRFLGLGENVLQGTIPQDVLDKLNDAGELFDINTILNNKLGIIAKTKSNTAKISESNVAIEDVSYDEAMDIASTFNLQNAAREKYIAIIEHTKSFAGKHGHGYSVKLVHNSKENIEKMKKDMPMYAPILACIDFFESVGLVVHLDLFNPNSAGTEFLIYNNAAADNNYSNDLGTAVLTVITLCTNFNPNYTDENLQQQVSRNAARMAARIFMEAAERNPEFKKSIGYLRLETAVQRYINTHPNDKVSVENLMELLIANEIEARIKVGVDTKSNITKSSKKLGARNIEKDELNKFQYITLKVKLMFNEIKNWFHLDLVKARGKLWKWRTEKFLNKPINIKQLLKLASKAVDEMFFSQRNAEEINYGVNNYVEYEKLNHRLNLKRYVNQELKAIKNRQSKTLKLLVKVEGRLKTHLNILKSRNRIKEITHFEDMIDGLDKALSNTNSTGGAMTSQRDLAARALAQVGIDITYELLRLSSDLEALGEKMLTMVPDYTDPEYMDCVQKLLELESRYKSFVEVKQDIADGLKDGLVASEVSRLGPDGVEVSHLSEVLRDLDEPMNTMKGTFEDLIDKVNLDLLEQIIGTEEMNIVVGKMFTKKSREKYLSQLEKAKDGGNYFESRGTLKKLLEDPGNFRTSIWYKLRIASPQNSTSLLIQVAFLAINRANMEANNTTLQTLYTISEGRRQYKGLLKAVIERDVDGVPTGNLIRPIDYTKYELELAAAEKEWGKEFTQLHEDKDYTYDELAILWKGFRLEKFNEWNKVTNEKTGKTDLKYKKLKFSIMNPRTGEYIDDVEMYAPNKDIYINTEWDTITGDALEASEWFFGLKYFSDLKLDGLGSGAHKIPLFKGSVFDTFWGEGITHIGTLASNTLRRSFLEDLEDEDFGAPQTFKPFSERSYADTDSDVNTKIKRIPLYGIRKLQNMNALSTDLYSSYLAYDDMSNNYAAKNKVETLLSSVKLQADRSISKNDSSRASEKTHWWQGRTFREEFELYMDREIYGLKKQDITLGTFGIRLAKIFNHIGRFTTVFFLGGNIHSSFINLVTGYNEIIKEAGVGEFINKRDLIKALATYTHNVLIKKLYFVGQAGNRTEEILEKNRYTKKAGQFLRKMGNENAHGAFPYLLRLPTESPNLVDLIFRDFDFTARFTQDVRSYTTNVGNKIARNFINPMRLVMLPYELTDHWMLAVPLLSMLYHEKVYDRNGKEISLMTALYGKYGTERMVDKPDFIDTGNRFGIFYKDPSKLKEGEKLMLIIERLDANIKNHYSQPNYVFEQLTEYKDEFNKYRLAVPTTIKDFERTKAKLSIALNKLTYNNADLAAFLLKAREVVNRMHGVYDLRSKGQLGRSILGALFLSMRNYAIGLINKRLMEGHWNMTLNKWDEGTLITVAKVMIKGTYDAWQEAKLWGTALVIASLVLPYVGKKMLGKVGFSQSLILNLKRAKLDMLRVLFWGVLSNIVRGLGSGWIGGYDDEDDEKALAAGVLTEIERMLGWHKTEKLTRKDVLNGNAFKKGGALYSDVTFRLILEDLGFSTSSNLDIFNAVMEISDYSDDEADFVRRYVIPHIDDVFIAYGESGGINTFMDTLYTEWCQEKPEERYYTDKSGRVYRGFGRNKNRSIFPKAFEKMLQQAFGDGEHLPKTKMQQLTETQSKLSERLEEETFKYESGKLSKEQMDKTFETIRLIKNQLTAIKFIKNGHNIHTSEIQLADFKEREKLLYEEYGVSSLEDLKFKAFTNTSTTESDIKATKELKKFLESYESVEKKLANAEKAIRNRDFENAYFKNQHPNAYYLLGIANYITERALLEQESFVPFADFVAREGGKYVTNTLFTSEETALNKLPIILPIVSGIFGKTISVMPKLAHFEPLEKLQWSFNAVNEVANLVGVPAFTAAWTSASNLTASFMNFIFGPSQKDYEQRIEDLKRQRDNTNDENVRNEIQNEIDEMSKEWDEYHAQNSTARLEKGEHKVLRYKSFLPYIRTFNMMGFDKYLEGKSLEGGWEATKSFKSFWQKEDKGKR